MYLEVSLFDDFFYIKVSNSLLSDLLVLFSSAFNLLITPFVRRCKICQRDYKGTASVNSNFITHLKVFILEAKGLWVERRNDILKLRVRTINSSRWTRITLIKLYKDILDEKLIF